MNRIIGIILFTLLLLSSCNNVFAIENSNKNIQTEEEIILDVPEHKFLSPDNLEQDTKDYTTEKEIREYTNNPEDVDLDAIDDELP